MNRETFLAERRKGIGSSDAAAIVGLSPFGNPLSVYLDKLGLLPPRESPEMSWGLRLEDVIAGAYAEEKGRGVFRIGESARHPEHPWMLANLDGQTSDGRIVELKTARSSKDWGDAGTDQVPEAYLVQVQHQMAVVGADCADMAVLIGGSDFRIYTVPRSPGLIERLIDIEGRFWDRVVTQIPPPADWNDPRTPELIALLHRPTEGKVVELGAHPLHLAEQYTRLRQDISELAKANDELKARLIEAMGDAEYGRLADGRTIRRKEVHRKAYVCKETTFFDFRISANPKE